MTPGPQDVWPVWSPDGSVLIYSSLDQAQIVGEAVQRSHGLAPAVLVLDPTESGGAFDPYRHEHSHD